MCAVSIKRFDTGKLGKPHGISRAHPRALPALPDVPDIRDLPYLPSLRPPAARLAPPSGLFIMDQGQDGACTGFGLAAVIHVLNGRNGTQRRRVSPFMLYSMARLHDEWPGEDYEGSSLRGALRGFFNNGACALDLWPAELARKSKNGSKTVLTDFVSLEAAKDARRTALGAYYRLRPVLADYHAAINETGAIYASAAVHDGWDEPANGVIAPRSGGPLHAFAIVGYDESGFFVQNSWGKKWAKGGVAHWPYRDWALNIQDAWVLQLAVEAPEAFGIIVRAGSMRGTTSETDVRRTKPTRSDIAGHFVHLQNGVYSDKRPYWSDKDDTEATAQLVASKAKYRHLLLYAHGGLNSPDAAAERTAAMTNVFLQNGIYPYSVFYDTGLVETLKDLITGQGASFAERTGFVLDVIDSFMEKALSGIGTRLWREMKADATLPFEKGRDGEHAIGCFLDAFSQKGATPTAVHIVGHSTGAILLGNLLGALDRISKGKISVESCTLLAPACTLDFYKQHYLPRLGIDVAAGQTRINRMRVFNLKDAAEQDDSVTPAYNKSLLYLVSNAFEEKERAPILGMERFASKLNPTTGMKFVYASASSKESNSSTHGGFDNDPATMNSILRFVLQNPGPLDRAFTANDLNY